MKQNAVIKYSIAAGLLAEITRGGCYRVEGWDKEKRRVKQYYNAQTGELVRSRMDRDWDDDRYDDGYGDGRRYQGYMGRWHDGMMRRDDMR
ncbi:PepSY domain-containing protein [Comamonadaceae bacterium M7527]|nr:PepSY domain-containing protein [Comamonadaceae bacterium M7527]